MQVVAILAANAISATIIIGAFCSSPYVVFMQIVTLIALFAQAFQPVFTDEVV